MGEEKTTNEGKDAFYVDFVFNDNVPYLFFNNHGKIKKCYISGGNQIIVCKAVFSKPESVLQMISILNIIRKRHLDNGTELKNDSVKVVITAIDNINEKAVPELGLDEKLLFHNQALGVGLNPKYRKIVET